MTPTTTAQAKHAALITAGFVQLLSEATKWPTMEAQQQLMLLVLYEKGEVDQRELGKYTRVGTTSNNRNIARLGTGFKRSDSKDRSVGLGWVESYRDPEDQRYTKVRLTPLGQAEMDRIALTVAQAIPSR